MIYHVVLVSGVQQSVILQLFPIFVLFFRPMVSVCGVLLTHFMDVTVVFVFFLLWTRVIIIVISSSFTEDYLRIVTCTQP